ncbi:hypothetical protein NLX86_15255 [Streptomyces sp. A3M-1-3]|uniref:hypothetical protein n=1 Tax=Streptomyces sp. A3M-1-3 TaxID=2962044 RepID=UPI0020B8AE02|nr:hypothetical protein [Streptomyces sp. A3M-1-3]MCP3819414.1 hypothetical protein [Streptomyces sp. A3M-1-3]
MTGADALGRRRRRAAALVLCTGAAAGFGTLVLLGRTLGALAPTQTATGADLAAWTWTPAVLWTLHQLLSAEPALGRSLVRPPDDTVLRTLPVSRGQLVAARLVLPTTGVALALLLAVGAVAVPWLAATGAGRQLLPVLLVNLCGSVTGAAALRILLVSVFMVRVVRVAHLPRVVLAAVGGWLVGTFAAPFVRLLGSTPDDAEANLTRRLGDAVADSRPQVWTAMHTPGRLWWTVAGYLAVAVVAGTVAALRVRATEQRDATAAYADDTAYAHAESPRDIRLRTTGRDLSPSPMSLVLRLTWLRLRRADPAAVGGVARLQRLSITIGAACAGTATALEHPPWHLPTPALAGLFIAAALISTGEVVQICGIEADRGCWDVLRQSPLPTGAWPAAKVVASAAAVLAVTAPFCLGAAALCGVSGARWGVAVLLLPAVAAAAGCASVLTWYVVPVTESFEGGGRTARPPMADVVEGVLTALLTLPVTVGLGLSEAVTDGGFTQALEAALLICVLAACAVSLRRVGRRDFPVPRPTGRQGFGAAK